MNKWPGAPYFGSLYPAGAEIKTLIVYCVYRRFPCMLLMFPLVR